MSTRAGVLAIVLAATSAACAGSVPARLQASAPPSAGSCHGVIDGVGQVSDHVVAWHAPPDPSDREWLETACTAVGPVVFAPRQTAAASAAVGDVRFVTWNVFAGTGDVRALVEFVRRDEPEAPLVLLLQDVFRTGAMVPAVSGDVPVPRAVRTTVPWRHDIVALARALDLHLVYIPSVRNGRGSGPAGPEDRGNAILSTLPLSAVAAIELPRARHRRVAMAATITGREASGRTWSMRVASVHLDTVGSWRHLYLFSSWHRARQADHVIEVLGRGEPVVLGADLNTWAEGPAEPAVSRLLRAFPDTPAPRWQPTFQHFWRLDYLFFRLPETWEVRSGRLDGTFGSDHQPVAGRVVAVTPPLPPGR